MPFSILSSLVGALTGVIFTFIYCRLVERGKEGIYLQKESSLNKELTDCRSTVDANDLVIEQLRAQAQKDHESLRETEKKLAAVQATQESDARAAAERIQSLLDVEKKLQDSFEAVAGRALEKNSSHLIEIAREQWRAQKAEAENDLAKRQSSIEVLLKPMGETLEKLSEQSKQLETLREGAYQGILTEVRAIQQSHSDLNKQTAQLVHALRSPRVRGTWGELQLKKCVEFSGMVQHASFNLQTSVTDENNTYRPDLEVHLPNGRTVIVDAKTPLDAFLSAADAPDEEVRARYLRIHAENVRKHLESLSKKAYQKQFPYSPDFVICFLPSEVLFAAALENDPSLIEFGVGKNVLLATPTTLIAMLRAVACGWQQASVAENAKKIQVEAVKVYEKLRNMQADFQRLGQRLKSAEEAYNSMLAKVEGQGGIFSIGRRLNSLEIGDDEIEATETVLVPLRQPHAEEWTGQLSLAATEDIQEAGTVL